MKNRTYLWITVLVVLLVAAAAALSVGVYSALALDSSTVSAAETSLEQAQDLCIATQPSDHTHAEGTAAHSHDQVIEIEEGKTHPTVALSVAPDPVSGWNVRVETANFRFSPENASTADVLGEGHAHLYVDGEKLARLYGEWFHIGKLEPGTHHIVVSLNGNSHAAYYYAGEPIEAAVTLEVSE